MNLVYVLRRLLFATLTLPFVLGAWVLVWVLGVALSSTEVGSIDSCYATLPYLSFGWVMFWVIYPELIKK